MKHCCVPKELLMISQAFLGTALPPQKPDKSGIVSSLEELRALCSVGSYPMLRPTSAGVKQKGTCARGFHPVFELSQELEHSKGLCLSTFTELFAQRLFMRKRAYKPCAPSKLRKKSTSRYLTRPTCRNHGHPLQRWKTATTTRYLQ